MVEATAGYQAIKDFDAENVEALSHYKNKAVDAVGDVIVTLIMVCATMAYMEKVCGEVHHGQG